MFQGVTCAHNSQQGTEQHHSQHQHDSTVPTLHTFTRSLLGVYSLPTSEELTFNLPNSTIAGSRPCSLCKGCTTLSRCLCQPASTACMGWQCTTFIQGARPTNAESAIMHTKGCSMAACYHTMQHATRQHMARHIRSDCSSSWHGRHALAWLKHVSQHRYISSTHLNSVVLSTPA